jgi:hypothetical protein
MSTSQALKNNENDGLAIDFMILSIKFDQDKNPKVNFTAFDITIGDKKY